MNFTHHDLSNLNKGRVVEVHLTGNAANVYLMDSPNLSRYKRGVTFQAIGGLMKASPTRLQATDTSHWHLIVDLPNGFGSVKTSYRIMPANTSPTHDKLMSFKPTSGQIRAVPAQALASTSARPATAAARPAVGGKGIVCNKCGKETTAGKFCPECGTSLDKVCPKCSIKCPPNSKFCTECGGALG